jgi:hypothetical protein
MTKAVLELFQSATMNEEKKIDLISYPSLPY